MFISQANVCELLVDRQRFFSFYSNSPIRRNNATETTQNDTKQMKLLTGIKLRTFEHACVVPIAHAFLKDHDLPGLLSIVMRLVSITP